MADAGFYRGTSSEQDSRFTDKQRKLLKQMRFETVLDTKIETKKVNLDVLKPWITKRVNEILGMEDDVVIEYVFSQLEEKTLDPKVMQINLTGFLNAKRSREFMGELWQLMLDGQNTEDGIPPALVEMKMHQLQKDSDAQTRRYRSDDRGAGRGGGDMDRRRRLPSPIPDQQRRRPALSNDAPSIPDKNDAGSDWKSRYESVSHGRFSGPADKNRQTTPPHSAATTGLPIKPDHTPPRRRAFDENKVKERERVDLKMKEREEQRIKDREEQKTRERERLRERERERERDRERLKEREKEREKERDRDKERRKNRRPSPSRRRSSPTGRRRFTETKEEPKRRRFTEQVARPRRSPSSDSDSDVDRPPLKRHALTNNGAEKAKAVVESESDSSSEEEKIVIKKKRKEKVAVRESSESDSDSEMEEKKMKKKKKEKKHKKHKKQKKGKKKETDSDSDSDDDNERQMEDSLRKKALASLKKRAADDISSSD